jgi:penicillin-binding protein 1C
MNRLAFGRGAVGIEAAAQKYFGHPAASLSPAEAAYLAVLPRAPGYYGRSEWAERLETRRREVLAALRRSRGIDFDTWAAALRPPEVVGGGSFPFEAPHLTGWLLDQLPPDLRGRAGTLRTTIDGSLQAEVEDLVRTQVARLSERGARQAAVVVIDNGSGEVLAMVGSADFFDETAGGQVNGALARRQPGSALKPFTYALAFENDFTPASVVADVPAAFPASGGPFVPRNYGGTTFGPVRLREALGSSLNIAAVELLSKVGTNRLFALLRSLHLAGTAGNPELYGLGLTLGVGEVRLLDLTAAYAALAAGGVYKAPVALHGARDPRAGALTTPPSPPPVRLVDPLAVWWVTDILEDDAARYRSFGRGGVLDMPWPVAAKTGTSSDWRDNWAMGYTRERTVGVWVGDFSGEPMQRVSGVYGAGPILREVFQALSRRGPLTRPPRPQGLERVALCSLSGALSGSACPGHVVEYLPPDRVPTATCSFHGVSDSGIATGQASASVRLPAEYAAWARDRGWEMAVPDSANGPGLRILTPAGEEVYFLDPAIPRRSQMIVFEAFAPPAQDRLEWRIDGRLLGVTRSVHRLPWPLAPGTHDLTVTGEKAQATVRFCVEGLSAPGASSR